MWGKKKKKLCGSAPGWPPSDYCFLGSFQMNQNWAVGWAGQSDEHSTERRNNSGTNN